MDLAGLGVFLTAVFGCITGSVSIWRSVRQNRQKADKSAVAGYVSLVDDMRVEIGRFQSETGRLQGLVEACHKEKETLQSQINHLYRELGRNEGTDGR